MYLYLKFMLGFCLNLATGLFFVAGHQINKLNTGYTKVNYFMNNVEWMARPKDTTYSYMKGNESLFLGKKSDIKIMDVTNDITKIHPKLFKRSSKPNFKTLFITMNMRNTSLNSIKKDEQKKSLPVDNGLFFLTDEKARTKSSNLFSEKNLELHKTRFKMYPPMKSPHAVLLLANTSYPRTPIVCSGTLVTDKYVLTAASCLKSMKIVSDIVILAGGRSINELNRKIDHVQKRTSSRYLCHPNYTSVDNQMANDIAIVKAQSKFNLSAFVNVLKLSRIPWSHQGFVNCSVTGYGKVHLFQEDTRDYMRKTYSLSVKKPCKCFEGSNTSSWMYADPSGPGGMCAGDVGSGLVCDGDLVAVTSQPLLVNDLDSCDLRQPPVYYSECGSEYMVHIFNNIYPYLKWVDKHTNRSTSTASKNTVFTVTYMYSTVVFLLLYLSMSS